MYATLKLREEYGELSEAVLTAIGHQRKSKLDSYQLSDLEGEIADVLIQTMVIAAHFNVDMSSVVEEKINVLKKKFVEDKTT